MKTQKSYEKKTPCDCQQSEYIKNRMPAFEVMDK